MQKNFNLFFFYKHKWPFCRKVCRLEYDFYCILIHENRLIQFVIEFDGGFHYEKTEYFNFDNYHKSDIIKQYYLLQMNVHLLRLTDVKQVVIECFINRLIKTSKYLSYGKINPIKKIFTDDSDCKGLIYFGDYFCYARSTLTNSSDFVISIFNDTEINPTRYEIIKL